MEARIDLGSGALDPRRRADRWRHELPRLFGGVRVWTPAEGLAEAAAEVHAVGPGRLGRVEGSKQRLSRAGRPLDDGSAFVLVLLQRRGVARLDHGGAVAELRPGDAALIDGLRPVAMELPGGFEQTLLQLPRGLALGRHRGLEAAAGKAQRGGGAALLFEALAAGEARVAGLSAAERACAGEGFVALLGLLAERTASEAERFEQALSVIEAELGDPDLDATRVARRQGVSRRRLDAVFAERGLTVARCIRERRLRRLAEALRDPGLARRSVLELALRCGFTSAAHAARAFRERFGEPPSAWRRSPHTEVCGPLALRYLRRRRRRP